MSDTEQATLLKDIVKLQDQLQSAYKRVGELKTSSNDQTVNHEATYQSVVLGTPILRFELPVSVVDQINYLCDNTENLERYNDRLAGKIKDEFNITPFVDEDIRNVFLTCFNQYLTVAQKPNWNCSLDEVWFNDMRANEYNPFHFHRTAVTDIGLSSVLMLKRPSTYGEEYSKEEEPRNGWLALISGSQDPLSTSMYQMDAQVGDLFIFPYTLLHGVYPFNGTDEIRRTLSWNCNLVRNSKKTEK
tara:strand:+ start:475 stop:1209 length:735 start_codon:yes stop_codon:yes gene_type:complete